MESKIASSAPIPGAPKQSPENPCGLVILKPEARDSLSSLSQETAASLAGNVNGEHSPPEGTIMFKGKPYKTFEGRQPESIAVCEMAEMLLNDGTLNLFTAGRKLYSMGVDSGYFNRAVRIILDVVGKDSLSWVPDPLQTRARAPLDSGTTLSPAAEIDHPTVATQNERGVLSRLAAGIKDAYLDALAKVFKD